MMQDRKMSLAGVSKMAKYSLKLSKYCEVRTNSNLEMAIKEHLHIKNLTCSKNLYPLQHLKFRAQIQHPGPSSLDASSM